jgi:hypothetical protein
MIKSLFVLLILVELLTINISFHQSKFSAEMEIILKIFSNIFHALYIYHALFIWLSKSFLMQTFNFNISIFNFYRLHFNLTFQPYISTLHFNLTLQPYISTLHFNLTLQPYISTLHFNLTFQPYISTLHFNLTFQHYISTLHFNLTFQPYITTLHFNTPSN